MKSFLKYKRIKEFRFFDIIYNCDLQFQFEGGLDEVLEWGWVLVQVLKEVDIKIGLDVEKFY